MISDLVFSKKFGGWVYPDMEKIYLHSKDVFEYVINPTAKRLEEDQEENFSYDFLNAPPSHLCVLFFLIYLSITLILTEQSSSDMNKN